MGKEGGEIMHRGGTMVAAQKHQAVQGEGKVSKAPDCKKEGFRVREKKKEKKNPRH